MHVCKIKLKKKKESYISPKLTIYKSKINYVTNIKIDG